MNESRIIQIELPLGDAIDLASFLVCITDETLEEGSRMRGVIEIFAHQVISQTTPVERQELDANLDIN